MPKPSLLQLEDVPGGPSAGTLIVRLEDIPEHGGKDVLYKNGAFQVNIFVQRHAGTVRVYENRCPHAGTPLNMFGDKFLNVTKDALICRTHGALFDIATGLCTAGPCRGKHLRPIDFEVRDGALYTL
ncbi:MAG: Rieske (2Fe-2S) protein [Kordiimonas sp.]